MPNVIRPWDDTRPPQPSQMAATTDTGVAVFAARIGTTWRKFGMSPTLGRC